MRIAKFSRSILGISKLLPVVLLSLVAASSQAAGSGPYFNTQFLGSPISFASGLANPFGVVTDAVGNIYVAESNGSTGDIREYAPSGSSTVLPISGLVAPEGIALDSTGALYITDAAANSVIKYAGGVQSTIPVMVDGQPLNAPGGIGVDGLGNVFVSDTNNDRLIKIAGFGAGAQTAVGISLSPVLYGPGGIAIDKSNNLFLADNKNARVVEIAAGGTQTVVTSALTSPTGVAVDQDGNLFIADAGAQQVVLIPFENGSLNPADSAVLPSSLSTTPLGVGMDLSGNLYVTDGLSAISKIQTHAVGFGSSTIGGSATQLTLNYQFKGFAPISAIQVLTSGSTGLGFKSDASTTCTAANHSAGQSCSVTVDFSALAPGVRQGAVVFYDNNNIPVSTIPIYGLGVGPEVSFGGGPGTQNVIAPSVSGKTFSGPASVALDAAGNLYVADTLNNRVVELLAGGGGQIIGTLLQYPVGVALDGAGNLFVADTANPYGLIEIPNENGTLNTGHQVALSFNVFYPTLVTFDGAGNLWIADSGNNRVVKIPNVAGNLSLADEVVVGTGLAGPSGVAIDAQGNAYIADTGNDRVVKVTPLGVQTSIGTGLSAPSAVSLDAAGNIYIADTNKNREVLVTPNGTQSVVNINVGPLNNPGGTALDSAGDLYIADFSNNRVVEISSAAPSFSFGGAFLDGYSPTQTFPVTNIGNAPLSISALNFPPNFGQTTAGSDCTNSTTLNGGDVCNVGVIFTPVTSGSLSGQVALTDNNLNAAGSVQDISVSGTGVAALGLNWTALNFDQNILVGNRSSAWPVTVYNFGNGTVNNLTISLPAGFTYDSSTCGTSMAPSSSCTFNVYFQPTVGGTASGSLVVSGNGFGNTVSIPVSGQGTAAFIRLNWSALNFNPGTSVGSQSSPWPVTMQNYTAGTLSSINISLPTGFILSGTNTCTSPVASGGTCSFNVVFAPQTSGSFNGNLTVTSGVYSASSTVSGAASGGVLSVNWTSITFGQPQVVGTSGQAWPVTVTNNASGTVTGVSVSAPAGFSVGQDTCTGSQLTAGASCTFNAYLSPTIVGTQSGTLSVTSTQTSPSTIHISGVGQAPALYTNWTSLTFGSMPNNTSSSAWPVTVTNATAAPATLSFTVPAQFTADTTGCAAQLAVNASCTFNVYFTPTSTGSYNSTLTVTDGSHPTGLPVSGAAY